MSATDPSLESPPVEDSDSIPQDLARQLRDTRKKKGLSRAVVARSAGLTRRELRAYETGKVPIPESDLWCLAGSCGVPVDALLPGRSSGSTSALGALAAGDLLRRLAAPQQADHVLHEYLAMVYELRNLAPGSRVPLADEELRQLAGALGGTPEAIEHRLVELAGVTPAEAARLRAMILPPLALSVAHDPAPAMPDPVAAMPDPVTATPDPIGATADPFTATPDPFAAQPAYAAQADPFVAQPEPFAVGDDPYAALEAEAATYEPAAVFASGPAFAHANDSDEPFGAWAQDGAGPQTADREHPAHVGVGAGATGWASQSGADSVGAPPRSGSSNGSWGLDPELRDRTMALIDELLADPAIGDVMPDGADPTTIDPFGFERTPLLPDEPADELGFGADPPAFDTAEAASGMVDAPVLDTPVDDVPPGHLRVGEMPIVDLPGEPEDAVAWATDPWEPEPWTPDPWAAAAPVTEPIDVIDASAATVAGNGWEPTSDAPSGNDAPSGWWADPPADATTGPTLLDDLPLDAMLDGFVVDTGFADAVPSALDTTTIPAPAEPDAELDAEPDAELDSEPDGAPPRPIAWSITDDALAEPEDSTAADDSADPEPAPEPESWRDAGPGWQLGGTFPNAAISADGMLALRRAETRWALADVDGGAELIVDADVDLVSGAGFGVVFHADVDAQGRLGAYSFDVDPVRDGGTFLVRQWNENREHWRPLAEAPIGPDVVVTGRHSISVDIRGDAITARFDGRRVLAVTGLSRVAIATGQAPCNGVRVGVHAWSTTEINVFAFRVGDIRAESAA